MQPIAPSPANSDDTELESLLDELASRIPDYQSFFTLDELRGRHRSLRAEHSDLVRIQTLGESRGGEPIELISIGDGPKAALIVAGVHANEAVGSLTVEFLLAELTRNPRLLRALGYTWHFINPIDPDGMRLNEPWFNGPVEPAAYFHDFFRPALARQPDYTFPLTAGPFSFKDSPPENLAFRQAIDLVKPDFQYTLHNAEHGGAFFLTSRPFAALEHKLAAIPPRFGVLVDNHGEPFSGLAKRGKGVFAIPRPLDMVHELVGAGVNPREVWPAGASSTDHAEQYGTFSFTAEVPYWVAPSASDEHPSGLTMRDMAQAYVGWLNAGTPLLERWRERIESPDIDATEPIHALREQLDTQRSQLRRLGAALAANRIEAEPLTAGDAILYRAALHLITLRPFALLARVARSVPGALPAAAGQEAWSFLVGEVEKIRASAGFQPVPRKATVAVQAISGLIAASMIAHQR